MASQPPLTEMALVKVNPTDTIQWLGQEYKIIKNDLNLFKLDTLDLASVGLAQREIILFDQKSYNTKNHGFFALCSLLDISYTDQEKITKKELTELLLKRAMEKANMGTYVHCSPDETQELVRKYVESKEKEQGDSRPKVFFDEFDQNQIKICRHAALEAAYLIKYFMSTKDTKDLFKECQVYICHDYVNDGEDRHAWCVFKSSSDNFFYLVDPTYNMVLNLNEPGDLIQAEQQYSQATITKLFSDYISPKFLAFPKFTLKDDKDDDMPVAPVVVIPPPVTPAAAIVPPAAAAAAKPVRVEPALPPRYRAANRSRNAIIQKRSIGYSGPSVCGQRPRS